MSKNLLVLRVTSAMMIGGQIQKAGTLIEVTEQEATQYLGRKKAVLVEGELSEAGPFSSRQTGGNLPDSGNVNITDLQRVNDTHQVDLDGMTLDQLKEYASKVHSEIPLNQKKADLLTAIKQAEIPKPEAEQKLLGEGQGVVIPTGSDTPINPANPDEKTEV